jgi:hypothetical protein
MTQPPKEKSLVVDVLTRYHQEYPHGEFTHDYIKDEKHCHLCKLREDRNKAIRIAEIEEQISELSIRYARGGAHPYEFAERMRILATEHSKATHD